MTIPDALSTNNDKDIEAITELIRMTNIEEVKAYGLRLINEFGD